MPGPRPTAGTTRPSGQPPPGCSRTRTPASTWRATAARCGSAHPADRRTRPVGSCAPSTRGDGGAGPAPSPPHRTRPPGGRPPPPGRAGAAQLDPHAEALLTAASRAGHRLVLSPHVGAREIAGMPDEVTDPGEPLLRTVRRLQADGRGVLLVSAVDGPALLAADVAVAPVRPGRAPAWGADLVTGPGLATACRLVAATVDARAMSRRVVESALTGNVLGALLAAVGSARYGQAKATTPGKSATVLAMADGTWTAVRVARRPPPSATVHTPWHALDADDVQRRIADLPEEPDRRRSRVPAPLRRGARRPAGHGPPPPRPPAAPAAP